MIDAAHDGLWEEELRERKVDMLEVGVYGGEKSDRAKGPGPG